MSIKKPAIKATNLTKYYGARRAVNNLSIEISEGEIFSLLGTNGAGKTTTIKMLCCLLQPTSGNASILNFDIRENPLSVKKIIGVSPQETAIASHLSTLENLMLMGGVFGMNRKESLERATHLMMLMELEDRKDQVRKLSGGMQRRLSIAMALMSDPQVIFLDEPTLGLDPHARRSVWRYIEKLKEKKTILLTTHYLEEADALADHIAIMDEGNIIEMGTSRELKSRNNSKQILKVSSENIPGQMVKILKKQGVEAKSTTTGIEVTAQEFDFYAIIDILRSNKIIITGIEMKEPTLDEVFLHLTGKEAEE